MSSCKSGLGGFSNLSFYCSLCSVALLAGLLGEWQRVPRAKVVVLLQSQTRIRRVQHDPHSMCRSYILLLLRSIPEGQYSISSCLAFWSS